MMAVLREPTVCGQGRRLLCGSRGDGAEGVPLGWWDGGGDVRLLPPIMSDVSQSSLESRLMSGTFKGWPRKYPARS